MLTTNRKRAGAAPSTTPSPESASRPSSQRSVRHQPLLAKPAHRRDPLVVAVIVDQGYVAPFGRAGEEEICRRNTAVIAIRRQRQLSLSRPGPKPVRHRNCLEGCESVGYLVGTVLIGSKSRQLKDDQVADQDKTRFHGYVEPAREFRKATITHPSPGAGIEERRPIELWQLQLSHAALTTLAAGGDFLRRAVHVSDDIESLQHAPTSRIAQSRVDRLAEAIGAQLTPRGIECMLVYINRGAGHAHQCRASEEGMDRTSPDR